MSSERVPGTHCYNQVAANDDGINQVAAVENATLFADVCKRMLDAPNDLPASTSAFKGLEAAVRALAAFVPGAEALANRVGAVEVVVTATAAEGATQLALQNRMGRHLLYVLAIRIGDSLLKGRVLNAHALVIFGAWCLRRLLEDTHPKYSAVAKVLRRS